MKLDPVHYAHPKCALYILEGLREARSLERARVQTLQELHADFTCFSQPAAGVFIACY